MQIRSRLKLERPESVFDKALEEELTSYVTDLARLLNTGLKFQENHNAHLVSFVSNGTANTEFSVSHNLKRVPAGRVILYQDKAGSLYQGPSTGTAWTSTTVYFKCDVSSVTFYVMFF